MAEFTFLELHFHDSDLDASAAFGPGEKEVTASDGPPEESDDTGSKAGTLFAAVVGLAFLVAVAYLARSRLGGEDDPTDAGDGEADVAL